MIEITLNKKEIIFTELLFLIISEIAFSFIIFIWFTLYQYGIIKSNPLFALIITFIQHIIILIILIKKNKINKTNIIRYIFILVILKILPLLYFFPNYLSFSIEDIFITIYLYLIYIILLISIVEIFKIKINLKKIIENEIFGENYEKSHTTKIFDYTYNELMSKIT